MVQFPIVQEIIADAERKASQEAILKFLEARFGVAARTLAPELKAAHADRLDDLFKLAATCRSLASFRKKLSP